MQKTLKVSEEIYKELIKLKGFLELKYSEPYPLNRVIAYLLTKIPDEKIKLNESLYLIEQKVKK